MPDDRVGAEGTPDAIVVGAGIAGLTVARDLAMGGLSVLVLEATGSAGGKARSLTVAGIDLDAGAESFATRGDTVASLVRELGLGDDLVAPHAAGAWLFRSNGSARPLPRTGMLGIPGTPMAADVIELVGLAGALRAQLDSLIPGPVGGRETFLGPFVRKRMGRRVLERLVTPVAVGVHSRHPDDLQIDRVAPGLRHAVRQNESLAKAVLALRASAPAGSNVAGLRGGVHRLVSELQSDVLAFGGEIRFGTTVVATDPDGVTTETGERISARHRVFTSAASTGGTPVVLATLVLDLPPLDSAPRGTGLLVEAGPTVKAKALTHASAKWAWLADGLPAHRHVVRLSYDVARTAPELLSPDRLERQAMADAALLLDVEIPADAVVGFARAEWVTAPDAAPVADGVVAIGEASAGVGLASVIAQARQEATRVLREIQEHSELAETDTPPEDD